MKGWQFWIDRGGTFTDIVAKRPNGEIVIHKLLSENPEHYSDAPVQGIRDILGLAKDAPIPTHDIEVVKMGTTVATNALLERKGDAVVFVTTSGFRDILRIGYQNRPNIFAREIVLPEMLYDRVIEVEERYNAQGEVLIPLNPKKVKKDLQSAYNEGIRSCAIALMHGYRYSKHEQEIAQIAKDIGFTQVSVSHETSPLMKIVSRGDTTVVDAYLSPILRRYVNQVRSQLFNIPLASRETKSEATSVSPLFKGGKGGITRGTGGGSNNGKLPKLMFMQSNGGLADATLFQGKDSILSGPAGGIVGAVKTSQIAGCDKIITFDMGGTSTDVAHYNGEYERTFETEIAGVRLRTPMMSIHTVAAGGGSVVQYDGARYRVGPESAGANPGPACYDKGGSLTITDCNVMMGKLQPDFFPKVFGENADSPLNVEIVREKFNQLVAEIGDNRTPEEVASGFISIAVEKMANAIKKISLQRGYDVSKYTLCCFGGAGGQHACLIADALGIKKILIHPYAGVLSAYGIGLADIRVLRQRSVERRLEGNLLPQLELQISELIEEGKGELEQQNVSDLNNIKVRRKLHLKYEGTDSPLVVNFGNIEEIRAQFEELHQQRYGFVIPNKNLIVESIAVELICPTEKLEESIVPRTENLPPSSIATVSMYAGGEWCDTPVYKREDLQPGDVISSPALIIEATGTNVIEMGWEGEITERNHLILNRRLTQMNADDVSVGSETSTDEWNGDEDDLILNRRWTRMNADDVSVGSETSTDEWNGDEGGGFFNHRWTQINTDDNSVGNETSTDKEDKVDPVMLEIFNNLFRSIAEQMGTTLQNTSYSVNIKERLDFSCAIFDSQGQLVANAPHIPVHLGSMSASVQSLIEAHLDKLKPGDVYVLNNPYNGGTHLPDVTVITPVFINGFSSPLFYVASRGHHADIGGITPGSMPPHSTSIVEEGVLLDNFKLVEQGQFREKELLEILTKNAYPVRNTKQNIADLQAQIAANEKGVQELHAMVNSFGLAMVQAYMQFVQDNAEESVRRAIDALKDGSFTLELDTGDKIQVQITINKETRSAKIDFTGTSSQLSNNFNAPSAIGQAAVLYVFRTLVNDDIPLNEGCLKPLEIILPKGSLLNPTPPAAVVAGNVETSQNITDCLYGALELLAASQGTMNNFTFGNANYQYYETICGGSGAGKDFHGADAVHTHMTNSRITDPEVLEWRFPVVLESFAIRPNSGGKGSHRGGNGVIRRLRFLEPMTAAILSSRRRVAPFGLHGGNAGATGNNYVEREDGTMKELGSTAVVEMNAGDVFVIETPGGGGYGKG